MKSLTLTEEAEWIKPVVLAKSAKIMKIVEDPMQGEQPAVMGLAE